MITVPKPKIWVLTDNRMGNTNQAIALAEKIGLDYQLKFVKYNILAKLPNFLLAIYPIHVKKQLLRYWEIEGLPDVIISSGRRTVSLASYLKRRSNDRIRIIQIMSPNLPFEQFDLIILPQHDKIYKEQSNILRITGALNNIQAKMQAGGIELRKNYPNLGQFISVIIGGNTKNYRFTKANARELATILVNITNNQHYNLFVSFSGRTPNLVKEIISNILPSSTIIYDPIKDIFKPNPYFGMLAEADYIISTADSISMCSEASSTGKPLYIFCPSNFKSPKHLSFIQQLIRSNIGKLLDNSVTYLTKYDYTPLNEIERISDIVVSKITSK